MQYLYSFDSYLIYIQIKKKSFSLIVFIVFKRLDTVCIRSSNPFYVVSDYIKWVILLGHTLYL